MYRSLIEPYFRSCCSVWGVCSTTTLNRPKKLQNRAARNATSSPYDASSQPFLKELGWPTVKELIETETARMVYRSINEEAPNYLTALFDRLSDRPVGTNFILGGLKRGASEASENGGPGACPRKNFS